MLGGLIINLGRRLPKARRQHDLHLLSATEFNREVSRERVRASRRSIPFCLMTIELRARTQYRRHEIRLVKMLERHLRFTDRKGFLGASQYGVLLVDTPERGGRVAMERIAELSRQRQLDVSIQLRVHDPHGSDTGGSASGTNDGNERRDDSGDHRDNGSAGRRQDGSGRTWIPDENGDAEVSFDDPMVPRPFLRMGIKRGLDIVGSGIGLLVTGPVILAAMAAIKLSDSGPALFTQTREGHRGKPFTIYKLRTMVVDAEEAQAELRERSHRDGPAFKIVSDPRVTRVGHFLRKTCIDELPQLWNVLRGEMSLVGPRPLPLHESRACENWHRRRLDVRPGLTCDWQVDKSQAETFDDWMRLDLRYIDEIGLLRDLRLIARTFTVPMTGRGGE